MGTEPKAGWGRLTRKYTRVGVGERAVRVEASTWRQPCASDTAVVFRFTLATELILVGKNGLEGKLERINWLLCPPAQKCLYNLQRAVNTAEPASFCLCLLCAVEDTLPHGAHAFPPAYCSARALGRICTKNPYYLSC